MIRDLHMCLILHGFESGAHARTGHVDTTWADCAWFSLTSSMYSAIIYTCWSGRIYCSRNKWNWLNTMESCLHRLCSLKSIDENFRIFSKYVNSNWILQVPKHSLLKHFKQTFTRQKSSKFEGSGPPLIEHRLSPLFRDFKFVDKPEFCDTWPSKHYLFYVLFQTIFIKIVSNFNMYPCHGVYWCVHCLHHIVTYTSY